MACPTADCSPTLPPAMRLGAQFGDVAEQLVLVGGIALHRLDQIGNEVGAALQLHVDAAPAFRHQVLVTDECVVGIDQIATDGDDEARMLKPNMGESPVEVVAMIIRVRGPAIKGLSAGRQLL